MRIRLLCLTVLLAVGIAHSQTVADAARKAREKKEQAAKSDPAKTDDKQTPAPTKSRVITNEDMSSGDRGNSTAQAESQSKPDIADGTKKTAKEWKQIIADQKAVVASMQSDFDALQKTVQFVSANGYSNGPKHNAAEQKKLDRLEVMKAKLQQEKDKLAKMRDDARKEGYGSAVYD